MHKRMIKRRLLSVAAALVFLLAVSGCSAEEKGSVYMNINPKKGIIEKIAKSGEIAA